MGTAVMTTPQGDIELTSGTKGRHNCLVHMIIMAPWTAWERAHHLHAADSQCQHPLAALAGGATMTPRQASVRASKPRNKVGGCQARRR